MRRTLKGSWLGITFDNHWVTLALVVYRRKQPFLRCLHQRPVLTHISETMEQALSSMTLPKFFGSIAVSLPGNLVETVKLEGAQISDLKARTPAQIAMLCQQFLIENGYADSDAWAWDIREQHGNWTLCAVPQEKIQFIKLMLSSVRGALRLITTSDDLSASRRQAEALITSPQKMPDQAIEAVSLTLLGAAHEIR